MTRYLLSSLVLLFVGFGGSPSVRGQSPTDPDTNGLPPCGASCILQSSALAKTPTGTCNPNHANCYCSRYDFANLVKNCAKQQCTAPADINITSIYADGYCADSRGSGAGNGNGGGAGNRTASLSTATTSTPTATLQPPMSLQPTPLPSPSSALSTATKVGIAIGAAVAVAIISLLAFLLLRRHRNDKEKQRVSSVYEVEAHKRVYEVGAETKPAEMDTSTKLPKTLFESQPVPVPVYELVGEDERPRSGPGAREEVGRRDGVGGATG